MRLRRGQSDLRRSEEEMSTEELTVGQASTPQAPARQTLETLHAGRAPSGQHATVHTTVEQDARIQASRGKNSKTRASTKVAWQAIWYIGAFYLTFLPDAISSVLYYSNGIWFIWLDLFAYFFLPLQGFLNFVVFARERGTMHSWLGWAMRSILCPSAGGEIRFCIPRSPCRSSKDSVVGPLGSSKRKDERGDSMDQEDSPSKFQSDVLAL